MYVYMFCFFVLMRKTLSLLFNVVSHSVSCLTKCIVSNRHMVWVVDPGVVESGACAPGSAGSLAWLHFIGITWELQRGHVPGSTLRDPDE